MADRPDSLSSQSPERAEAQSSFGRAVRFVVRHPIGAFQCVFFALVAVVVLQNLEPTAIDVLFWSVAGLPKLVLILLSMLLGGAAWEVVRRSLRR